VPSNELFFAARLVPDLNPGAPAAERLKCNTADRLHVRRPRQDLPSPQNLAHEGRLSG
jgi:hypothetical protein